MSQGHAAEVESTPDQRAKQDFGKPKLSLVPTEIIRAIATVRAYGNQKYEPDSWTRVEWKRYLDAALRHMLAVVDSGLSSTDEESGLLHLAHAACNIAFLLEFERKQVP
jgi:hypothetical protein